MCGIFGVFNARKAAELTVIGLHAIQHRAIDYAGMCSTDGTYLYRERGPGVVRQVFTKEMLDRLHGKSALGHIRYPTVSDKATLDNIQPILGNWKGIPFALAHNGNLTNIEPLLKAHHLTLATSMDSEIIVRLIEQCQAAEFERAVFSAMRKLEGSFSLAILTPDRLIAVRGPQGNRPLSIGSANGSFFLSSETCAFPNLGARYVEDVGPGTMASIVRTKIRRRRFAVPELKQCRFEGIYFSNPASVVFGERVSQFRLAVGRKLEELYPVDGADLVTPIPDSAMFIAMGYSESGRSGKYFPVMLRNHYTGRTFIAATQADRDEKVSQKFIFAAGEIEGKRIVVVDDSIVRGTTMPKIVGQLRSLGAREIHVRIGSPPITDPCRYGINTPEKKELISASLDPEEIRQRLGADSLAFLPLEALKEISGNADSFCWSCMTGNYW